MVYLLDADSVAEQGDLMPSDMVIEVNDQPLHSEKILLDILDTSLPGTQVSLRVLRGGLPYDLEFDIP
jgi:S1-C subfamily serine protease